MREVFGEPKPKHQHQSREYYTASAVSGIQTGGNRSS
jgi:hypothetical protein